MSEQTSQELERQVTLKQLGEFEQRARTAGARSFGDARLGAVLLLKARITEQQLADALRVAGAPGVTLEQVLLEHDLIRPEDLPELRANQMGREFVDLDRGPRISPKVLTSMPAETAAMCQAVPFDIVLRESGARPLAKIAIGNPANKAAIDTLTKYYDSRDTDVEIYAAMPEQVARILTSDRFQTVVQNFSEVDEEEESGADELTLESDDGPARQFFSSVLTEAVERRASDIHVEVNPTGSLRVRMRIDGTLQVVEEIPKKHRETFMSLIKIRLGMNIAEKRLPQDGRKSFKIAGRSIDMRGALLPTEAGETMVLRILDKDGMNMSLEEMGMSEDNRERFRRGYDRSQGAVLVTGPTGSGKSSTLYGLLRAVYHDGLKVITIENPVEYVLPGVQHVQVEPRIEFTFLEGLKVALRSDPEVIMVGEIRDAETAKTAMEAALTGHLMLSTLHTNDAPTAVTRLMEMGVPNFMVAAALNVVCAQRLIKRLCPRCRTPHVPTVEELMLVGWGADAAEQIRDRVEAGELHMFGPNIEGCPSCAGGYKGRTSVHEIMTVTPEIKDLIMADRADPMQIRTKALEQGMKPMLQDGIDRVFAGVSSLAEVRRVIS